MLEKEDYLVSSIINLKELTQRESKRVEWKENVADIEDIIKTSVAFANDYSNLGGGYIVCGAKEAKDEHGFQKLIETDLISSRLKQFEKLVISMKRLGQNEELIEFVNNAFEKNLTLSKNLILLENRARAKMDLAKKCIDTGRNPNKYKSPNIRAKAWETARNYITEAERDLNTALENVTSFVDKEYIKKDLDFIMKMKSIAQRPKEKQRHTTQGIANKGNKGTRKS